MTSEKLKSLGLLLYGDRWQSQAARVLQVSDRQVRRWDSGQAPVPGWVGKRLTALASARTEQISQIVSTDT